MPNAAANDLIDLAKRKTVASRTSLAETITDLFSPHGRTISDRERVLMFDILRKVVHDVEMSVRQRVSERLADLDDVPHDLIRDLANDTLEVAFPILTRSPILQNADLIEIVRHRSIEHKVAVAMRFSLSESVSAVLAEVGDTNVIETLLRNPNAQIAETTMRYLVEESRRVDTFQEPLLQRRELGPDLARRMFLWVSAALREHIIRQFNLDTAEVDRLLAAAAAEAAVESCSDNEPTAAERLVEEIDEAQMLDPDLLVQALTVGEVTLFVSMIARATGLKDRDTRRLLFDGNGESLAILCRAISIDRATFATIQDTIAVGTETNGRQRPDERTKALALFDRIALEDAERVVHRWRLDPEYVAAIDALEGLGAANG